MKVADVSNMHKQGSGIVQQGITRYHKVLQGTARLISAIAVSEIKSLSGFSRNGKKAAKVQPAVCRMTIRLDMKRPHKN